MKTDNNDEVENVDESSKSASEFVKELLKEKVSLSPDQHSNAMRLLDQEVTKAQSITGGKSARPESRYVDIYKEKFIKVVTKVLVPVKEHPKFNFVGKLLGPRGNSLKRLQEETMTKMAILGRGSMRDKVKEEELRNGLDPKYSHLSDELHVEIQAHAPPAEAYARIAFALAEIRKYLVPDINDEIRQEQLREIQQFTGPPTAARTIRLGAGSVGPPPRGGPGGVGRSGGVRASGMGGGRPIPPPAPSISGAPVPRPQSKAKVMSILDKARTALDESYGQGGYDDGGYYDAPAHMTYGSAYNGSGFYDGGGYGGAGEGAALLGGWKSYGAPPKHMDRSGIGKSSNSMSSRFASSRSSPYGRPHQ